MAIDNEFDAVHSQYDIHPTNPIFEILLMSGEKIGIPLGPLRAIREHFSKAAVKERVEALLAELERAVQRHERTLTSLEKELNSSGFRETLLTATAETVRIENCHKIERFARVLGHELVTPDSGIPAWEDASAFIRDLAQLGEADIQALAFSTRISPV